MIMKQKYYWNALCAARRAKAITEAWTQPLCEQYALSPSQLQVLLALHCRGAQTAGALAAQTGMAKGNSSAVVKQLQKKGLVQRTRQKADERCVQVSLSAEGGRLAQVLDNQLEQQVENFRHSVPPQRLANIEKELEYLDAAIRQYGKNTGSCYVKEKTHEQ